MEGDFAVRIQPTDSTHVVYVAGDLDLDTTPRLQEALAGIAGHVTIDCAALRFADSSALLLWSNHARNGGVTIKNAGPTVRRILEITGLDVLQDK